MLVSTREVSTTRTPPRLSSSVGNILGIDIPSSPQLDGVLALHLRASTLDGDDGHTDGLSFHSG